MQAATKSVNLEVRLSRERSAILLDRLAGIPTLSLNILRGRMTARELWMTLELRGAQDQVRQALLLGKSMRGGDHGRR